MKQFITACLLLMALGLTAGSKSEARTYTVAPGGSDASPGTPGKPLATIQKAADLAGPGDVVQVKSGVYRETVRLHLSGTAQAPIQFVATPAGSVTVTGADPMTGWKRVEGDAPIYQIPWSLVFAIDFRDGKAIEAHPEDATLWGRAEQVISDSRQLLPAESIDALRKAWADHAKTPGPTLPSPLPHLGGSFAGMFAADTAAKTLSVWMADNSDPNTHRMQAATRSQTFGVNQWESKEGVSYVQVRGFRFRYGASFPQRAVVNLHGTHNLIEDCVIEDMAGSGVSVGGTLRRCVIRGNGQTGGSATGDGFLNVQCLWEGNCWKPISRDWDAGGVKMTLINGGVFQQCLFRRNGGPGLWFDIDMRHVRVTQCVFDHNEGSGLMIEISRSNQVDHCLATGNGIGTVGNPGSWGTGGILLAESENCTVTNTTCVGNKDGITFREQGPRPLDTPDGTIPYHNTQNTVTNTLCANNQGYQLGLWYDNGFFGRHPADAEKYPTEAAYSAYLDTVPDKVFNPLQQNLVIDRNVYQALPGKPIALYGVTWRVRHQEFRTLTAWTKATGFDAHSRLRLGGNAAGKSQAGWVDAPANIDRWIRQWLPKWAQP